MKMTNSITAKTPAGNTNYRGAAHPMSDEIRREAQARMRQLPKRGRFGDKRDAFKTSLNTKEPLSNPCTSARSLSTMPQRQRGPENRSGYRPG